MLNQIFAFYEENVSGFYTCKTNCHVCCGWWQTMFSNVQKELDEAQWNGTACWGLEIWTIVKVTWRA